MHFEPQSIRYSGDLEFFHDSEERVAAAFAQDRETLTQHGYDVEVELTTRFVDRLPLAATLDRHLDLMHGLDPVLRLLLDRHLPEGHHSSSSVSHRAVSSMS